MKEFIFGTFIYEYQLIKQDRKTLSLTVTPDLRIIVKSPEQADNERIEYFLQKKWFWLEKQLSYFKKYQRKFYEKEHISGEGYFYLGRQYKLVVRKSKQNNVSLTRGQLIIHTIKETDNRRFNKKLLEDWFTEKAEQIFQDRFTEMLERFDYKHAPAIGIREMKRRWGSFINRDKVFLNSKLIHVPKACIDYVIVHELCHLRYKHHNKKFWELLDKKYPKWERIKEQLETIGAGLY